MKEENLICSLLDNKEIYNFTVDLFFNTINIAKKNKITNIENYINIEYLDKKFTNKKVLIKNGFICKDICKNILKCENIKEMKKILKDNSISLLQLSGALYKFTWEPDLITKLIQNDKKIKEEFLESYSKLFADDSNFDDIIKLSNKSKGEWFIPWVFTYGRSNNNIVRSSLNYDTVYVREALGYSRPLEKKDIIIEKLDDNSCRKKQFKNNLIINGASYFKIVENGYWLNLMKKNKKTIISGFSGSCIMWYQMVFELYKLKKPTSKNKILLLLLIIADFVPTYHSIPEILVTYTREANFKNIYMLKNDEISYIKKLLIDNNMYDTFF